MKCLDDGWEPAKAMRMRKTLSLKRGTGSGCWCIVDALGSFYQDRLGTSIGGKLSKRDHMRFSQDPTTLNHLVNGEPRIAALPSGAGIIIKPQTMSAVDKKVPAKPAFLGAIWPRKTKRSFCQDRLGTNIL